MINNNNNTKIKIDNINTACTSVYEELSEWWKLLKDTFDPKKYNRIVNGIQEIENLEKEGNNMIESINLVDLYAKKVSEKISEEANQKIKKIREENSLENKMFEIIENATNALNELYLSQLDDEQKEALSKGKWIDQNDFSLITREPIRLTTDGSLIVNELFNTDEITEIKEQTDKKLEELHEKVKIVKAHIGIAKTKEEVEDILKIYDVLDKKGKMVI